MIKENWFVGCATAQLKTNLYPTQIFNEKIVVFREASGKAAALKDRCCHRGLPLSQGTLCEGRIACGFHGWQYEGSGKCVKIPSQPNKPVPSSYAVNGYPCEERDGYIWVWLGESKPREVPTIAPFSSDKWIQGFRVVQCHYLRALEITFDSMHIYFAHPTHPATVQAKKHGFADSKLELRITDSGCITFAPVTSSESEPIPDMGFQMEFQLPTRIRFKWVMPDGQASYMYWSSQPVTENTCRMDWLISNFTPSNEHILWTEGGREIIEEDQVILEAIQKSYEAEGESFEKSVEADLPALTLRRLVRALEEGKWPLEKSSTPTRRIVSMKGPAGWE